MLGQPGSTPRELFEDQMLLVSTAHKQVKDCLKSLMKKGDLLLSTELLEPEFKARMTLFPEYHTLSETTQKYYYDYFIEKAKSKQKEHKKKIKKA